MREKIYAPLNNLLCNCNSSFIKKDEEGFLQNQDIFSRDWNSKYSKFRFAFDAFEKNFRVDLNFILGRIIKEREDLGRDTRNFPRLALDIKTFYIFLRIQMDIIAFLTQFFYTHPQLFKTGIKNTSFRKQKNIWLSDKGKNFDSIYSKLVKEKTGWFDKLGNPDDDRFGTGDREAIVHGLRWLYIECKDIKCAKIIKNRGHIEEGETEEVLIEIANYIKGFFEFCRNYEKYFLKKTKDIYTFKESSYWYESSNFRYLLRLVDSEHLLEPIDFSFLSE